MAQGGGRAIEKRPLSATRLMLLQAPLAGGALALAALSIATAAPRWAQAAAITAAAVLVSRPIRNGAHVHDRILTCGLWPRRRHIQLDTVDDLVEAPCPGLIPIHQPHGLRYCTTGSLAYQPIPGSIAATASQRARWLAIVRDHLDRQHRPRDVDTRLAMANARIEAVGIISWRCDDGPEGVYVFAANATAGDRPQYVIDHTARTAHVVGRTVARVARVDNASVLVLGTDSVVPIVNRRGPSGDCPIWPPATSGDHT